MKLVLVYISWAAWSGILVFGIYHLNLYLGYDPVEAFGVWLWVLLFLRCRHITMEKYK